MRINNAEDGRRPVHTVRAARSVADPYTTYAVILSSISGFARMSARMLPFSLDPAIISWSYLLQFIVLVPVAILALRSPGQSWHEAIVLTWVPAKVIAKWAGIWLVCWTVAVMLYSQLPVPVDPFLHIVNTTRHPGLLLSSLLLAPVLEEIMFRACGFRLWRHTRLGLYGTLFLTSLLFMLIHLGQYSITLLAFMFAFGVLLGLAREQSGSLLVPLVLHTLNNLLSAIVILEFTV